MATSPNLHPPSVAARLRRARAAHSAPLPSNAPATPRPLFVSVGARHLAGPAQFRGVLPSRPPTIYSSPIYSADSLSLINLRLGAKNSARTTSQSEHRHNRPTRNSPRHRPQHRQIHRRFSKSKRPLPACGRPARDQRNFQIKIRKAPPLRHKEANSTQPASRKPTSESLFTQFSESRVTIMASRSE